MTPNHLTVDQQVAFVNEWNNSTESLAKLAKKHGLCRVSTRDWFIKVGIPLKNLSESHRKYSLDTHYFDVIDTEEKAYFVGLLYADGCNYIKPGKHVVFLSLQEKDKDILLRFNRALSHNKPLSLNINKTLKQNKTGYRSNNYVLIITDKTISDRLNELGCVPAKTHKLIFPDWLEDRLYPHFVRGYFDGDGCVTGASFSLTGRDFFIQSLQNILIKELGLTKTVLKYRHPNSCSASCAYVGWQNLSLIYNWFYKDATIYLYRKKHKFEEYLDKRKYLKRKWGSISNYVKIKDYIMSNNIDV